ncbi:MAG TPA: TatD family deoxyribonuclease [Bacteroides sp.]|nr:TatD family deoxyribonuclease [Bacteroides sp.]
MSSGTVYTDSHAHLYLEAFAGDRDVMIRRALDAGVKRIFLPNIDSTTIGPLFDLAGSYPGHCFPMMGLHPNAVKDNHQEELKKIESCLSRHEIVALGEIGIDLYRDRTHYREQMEVFRIQLGWAKALKLPVVIHSRDSFSEIFSLLDEMGTDDLKGVFHSFTGTRQELERALSYGFMIGINGIVTFKNSSLEAVVRQIPLERLLIETDAPYLAPVPHRGKRNESSFILEVAAKVGEILNLDAEAIARITTANAAELFKLNFESSA